MPSGRPSWRWEGSATRWGTVAPVLTLVLVLLGGVLVGCSLDDEPAPAQAAPTAPLVDEVRAVVGARAAAVREGDLSAFAALLAPGRQRLVRAQEDYFLNLRELPLRRFRYLVPAESVTTLADGRVQAVVQLRMQLEEFDAAPVESPSRFTFLRDRGGTLRISAVRDPAFDREHDLELAPWDTGAIMVEEGNGVLGIFDADSADTAYQIIDAVEEGIADVNRAVPWTWSEHVVVYALSDTRILASLDDLPGGDPDRLDGVAFPVASAGDRPRLAATRFMLHPRMLQRAGPVRARLIRHELTHVVLGRRDDNVPIWLSEGIAEHVSVQPVPAHDRTIARAAVREARRGLDGLPAGEDFNGADSAANYGIAWQASAFIADAYGEQTLWRLFDEMRAQGGTSESDQDEVLIRVLGIDAAQLARSAGRRIMATFV